jgi:hypothetical protein
VIDLAQTFFQAVLLQVVCGRAEGVRLDDIRTRAHIFLMRLAHEIGIR